MNVRSPRGATCRVVRVVLPGLLVLAGLLGPGTAAGKDLADDLRQTMQFAADMAERGNWREARFRWEQAAEEHPDDPRVLNNLAVALEALGEREDARGYYERALAASGGHPGIRSNLERSSAFWRGVAGPPDEADDQAAGTEDDAAAEGGDDAAAPSGDTGRKGKNKGKTLRVSVGLPVPPRLKLEGNETVLVASFLSEETNLMDTNRELVRFLRSEFRKHTSLEIPEINPPPAIPEQTVEDLVANQEFWKHLGRNYDADLIVSGVVMYDREDVSTFRDVDFISEQTGQKVRRNQFVEQEQFQYALDLFFIDGATGTLRFRDRLVRTVIFQGLQNDPIAAFYALSESISADVLAVVTQRTRIDTRMIFKR